MKTLAFEVGQAYIEKKFQFFMKEGKIHAFLGISRPKSAGCNRLGGIGNKYEKQQIKNQTWKMSCFHYNQNSGGPCHDVERGDPSLENISDMQVPSEASTRLGVPSNGL